MKKSNKTYGVGPVHFASFVTIATVIFLVVLIGNFNSSAPDSFWEDHKNWGVMGDFIGGLSNPFIGAATLIVVVLTLYLSANEFKKMGEGLVTQEKNLEQQLEEVRKQRIDNQISTALEKSLEQISMVVKQPLVLSLCKIRSFKYYEDQLAKNGNSSNSNLSSGHEYYYVHSINDVERTHKLSEGPFQELIDFYSATGYAMNHHNTLNYLFELLKLGDKLLSDFEENGGKKNVGDFYKFELDRWVRFLNSIYFTIPANTFIKLEP